MPRVTATVEQVQSLKKGLAHGREWVLYKVVAGGQIYTTFDPKWETRIGQQATFDYEEAIVERDGKKYVNKKIVVPGHEGGGLKEILARLEAKLDRALVLMGDARPPQ